MDTGALFEKYTIDEIRDIEKRTRQEIERKKEELRQMVGERYRDLIEAADTITEMKNSAENVVKSVSRMQHECQKKRDLARVKGTTDRNIHRKKEASFYAIAAQMKLLMDIPEQLFLLARHVHTGLQLDTQQSARILTSFPVLTRQWAAIGHFRSTILQVTAECLCSLLLLEGSTPRQVFNEYLLARTHAIQQLCQQDQAAVSIKTQVCDLGQMIVTTVHQIYTIFYSGHPDHSDTGQQAGDSQGQGTKAQVPCNLLMTTLAKVTDTGDEGAIITEAQMTVAMRHLPSNVTEFRPSLRHHATPVSTDNINKNCQQWINTTKGGEEREERRGEERRGEERRGEGRGGEETEKECISDVNAGLTKLLTFISTVRGLALIRDQVWVTLKQDDRLQTWDLVCEQVLNRKVALWQEFFLQLFTDRTKTLLQEQFVTALENSKQHVAKVLSDLTESTDSSTLAERNLAAYIWTESAHDIPANRAWVVAGSNKNISQGGSLMMKAYAYTPAAQRLCQSLDNKLHVLLEDASHYIVASDTPEEGSTAGGRTMSEGADIPVFAVDPFDKFMDRDTVVSFIQSASNDCIHRLLDHLSEQLDRSKEQLDTSSDPHSCVTIVHRVLLLARLTAALCELSPELQCCVGGSVLDNLDNSRSARRSVQGFTRGLSKTQENPQWVQLKTDLQQFTQQVFSVIHRSVVSCSRSLWTTHICRRLVSQFASSLLDRSPKAILQGSMRWDDIEIEEETEEGTAMKSTIHVPMHASCHLHSLLYELCENINRVGAHATDRVTLGAMVTEISDGIVTAYETFLDDNQKASVTSGDTGYDQLTLTQNRALQMLFDLKFVMKIFPRKVDGQLGSKYQQRMERLEERLEKHIDPFDLDVFMPYMQQHVVSQTQRCSVMYGALTSLNKHLTLTRNTRPPAGRQEQHNVLPLSNGKTRFQLLPLSVQSRSSDLPPIVQPPQMKLGPKSGMLSPPLSSPTVSPPEESTSFLGQMSTIWFSNVGGKAK
ncbi:hypothetical protein NP493_145g03017 [Ridgeia piscesae]|uniref:Conserved oligomeric Golgi complex subunit 1 n=1 Tax=Ridgeia piscesae TaxID=27915 RepID=A0AAD9P4M6_RIDPI|nr:hypothetical protein NP493_145g03017 [Ridgeia piscesae]